MRAGLQRTLGSSAFLVIVTLLTLFPLFSAGYGDWDDTETIGVNREYLKPLGPQIAHYFSDVHDNVTMLYIPLTKTAWAMIAAVAKMPPDFGGRRFDPTYFHVFNLIIHAANTLLVYCLLRQVMSDGWPVVFGALVWAIHPLQVESVGWICGLKDLLAALGMLMALNCYFRFATSSGRGWLWYCLATAGFLFGLFAKSSAAITPLLALIVVWRFVRSDERTRKLIGPLLLWALIAFPFFWITRTLQPSDFGPQIALKWRPLIAADSLAFYVEKFIAPVRLCIDHGRRPDWIIANGEVYWTWIVPVGITGAMLWFRKRFAPLRIGLIFFAVALLPVLGLTAFASQRFSTVSDHYVYVALFGLVWGIAAMLQRYGTTIAVQLSAIVVAIALIVTSSVQASYWQNARSLFAHDLEVNPHSLFGLTVMGSLALDANHIEIAEPYFREALNLDPHSRLAQRGMEQLLVRTGRYAEAVVFLQKVIPDNPREAVLQNDLGIALRSTNRPTEAITAFIAAIRLNPKDAHAEANLARTLADEGDRAAARAHYERALAIDPDLSNAVVGLRKLNGSAPATHPFPQTMPVN